MIFSVYGVWMCASVIIFMRSVYTIAYFDTPILLVFSKVAVSCWFFEVALLHTEYHLLQEKRQLYIISLYSYPYIFCLQLVYI